MRSQIEILRRIKEVEKDDFFGFQTSDLLSYLEYENAKPYLKEGVTEQEWKVEKRTPKEVMINYMEFAWEKANNKRGLSASRTLDHYTSWLWLDGDETLYKTLSRYQYYGKDHLIKICEYLGIECVWDDGIREDS